MPLWQRALEQRRVERSAELGFDVRRWWCPDELRRRTRRKWQHRRRLRSETLFIAFEVES